MTTGIEQSIKIIQKNSAHRKQVPEFQGKKPFLEAITSIRNIGSWVSIQRITDKPEILLIRMFGQSLAIVPAGSLQNKTHQLRIIKNEPVIKKSFWQKIKELFSPPKYNDEFKSNSIISSRRQTIIPISNRAFNNIQEFLERNKETIRRKLGDF